MTSQSEHRKLLAEYLETQLLMSIATYGEHLWIATVYYVTDEDLNLYFISPSDAKHSKHIASNSNVACAIADSGQKATDKKVGLQIYGNATQETASEKIKWMLKIYNKLHPSTKDKFNFKNFETGVMTSRVYKVTPKEVKFFNQGFPGKEKELTIKF